MSENIKQGDSFVAVRQLVWDNGDAVDLRTATSVHAFGILYGDTDATFDITCEIVNAENGYINVPYDSVSTAEAGMYKLSFKCYFPDSRVLTIPTTGTLWLHIEENYIGE